MRFNTTNIALMIRLFSSTLLSAAIRNDDAQLISDKKDVESIFRVGRRTTQLGGDLTEIVHHQQKNERIVARGLKKRKGEGNIKSSCKSSGKQAKKGTSAVTDPCEPTIWEQLQSRSDEFSTFIELAELAGFEAALSGPIRRRRAKSSSSRLDDDEDGDFPITLFVPTNAAFESILPPNLLDKYLDINTWTERWLEDLLYQHRVSDAALSSSDLEDGQVLIENTGPISATVIFNDGTPPTLSSTTVPVPAAITEVDNIASNGVFHVIDQVLTPLSYRVTVIEAAEVTGTFSKFLDLLRTAGLDDDLDGEGPYTVYAVPDPVFDAYEAASPGFFDAVKANPNLASLLKYHYVLGEVHCGCKEEEFLNEAGTTLKIADIMRTNYTVNGVITVDNNGRLTTSNAYIGTLTNFLFPLG